ncbi:hypothetical protein [Corallococcus terminator]|uniref:Uncharacterized protein n=1 Tax=Corallococcus terminator TaxID=2316733 RepID=A0A3A8HKP6_9BACT|nr:hypothetical protein [Corallococcus terminator]RKG68094.1 hypothetical protein D7V88_40810 [Corallococcus terminator]
MMQTLPLPATRSAAINIWLVVVSALKSALPEDDLVSQVLSVLASVDPDWLNRFEPLGIKDGVLILACTSDFLEAALRDLYGEEIRVELARLQPPAEVRDFAVRQLEVVV